MTYQFAAGYDNAGSLAVLATQPKSKGVLPGRLKQTGDGLTIADGFLKAEWIYTSLLPADFNTLITALGLDPDDMDAFSVKATIKTLDNSDRTTFSNYNAIVSLPERYDFHFVAWRNVIFKISRMVAL